MERGGGLRSPPAYAAAPRRPPRVRRAPRRYDNPSEQEKFAARINRTPMLWCCITKHVANDLFGQRFPPGHIYYDFWYDTPHTDRFGRRQKTGSWELQVGP